MINELKRLLMYYVNMSSKVIYNLHVINNLNVCNYFTDNDTAVSNAFKLVKKSWLVNGSKYDVVKYKKGHIKNDTDSVKSSGLFRSVVLRDGNICCFSPPKTLGMDEYMLKHDIMKSEIQEYIEGTMVNLFYDPSATNGEGDWEISTRSAVGANVGFTSGKNEKATTFRYMFLDTCNDIGLEFDNLPKELCYSFVMKHPENCIVTASLEKKLYLVAAYKINNDTGDITEVDRSKLEDLKKASGEVFNIPELYNNASYLELQAKFAGNNTPYYVQGVMVRDPTTGMRSKIRNPNFEHVKKLRGNTAKLQFRYYQLRKMCAVDKYLKYFKQDTDAFAIFREQLCRFTELLYNTYRNAYIYKNMERTEIPLYLQYHCRALHNRYLNRLRPNKEKMSFRVVSKYLDNLHPCQLLTMVNMRDKSEKRNHSRVP